MWGMVIGALLVLLKVAELGPTANWPWWAVLTPFALIIVWWEVIVPVFGLRQKAEQKKHDQERKDRFERLYGKNKKS
jgi:small Trp-rich protein